MPSAFRPAGASDSEEENSDEDLFPSSFPRNDSMNPASHRNIADNWNGPFVPVQQARLAAIQGDVETIRKMLEENELQVDEDLGGLSKWTMFMYACKSVRAPLMNFLLEKGANPNFKESSSLGAGYTPLLALASVTAQHEVEDLENCLSILLEAGADITAKETNEYTALHVAITSNSFYLTYRFIELGLDINAADVRGRTALHIAAGSGYGRLVSLLLQAGCQVNAIDDDGVTACEVATKAGFPVIAQVLYKVESTSWTPGLDPALMQAIAELPDFSSEEKEAYVVCETQKDPIQLFLDRIHLAHLMTHFEKRNISYFTLLRLNDAQLRDAGISLVGDRLKILDNIRSAHNLDWQTSSIPTIMNRTNISMRTTGTVLKNVKEHVQYMTSSILYLENRIRDDPQILRTGVRNGKGIDLMRQAGQMKTNAKELGEASRALKKLFNQLDGNTEYERGDDIEVTTWSKRSFCITIGTYCLVGLACGFALNCAASKLKHGHVKPTLVSELIQP